MLTFSLYSVCQDRPGGLVEDRSPRMQEIGVQSPVRTDFNYNSSTAKRSTTGASVTGPQR